MSHNGTSIGVIMPSLDNTGVPALFFSLAAFLATGTNGAETPGVATCGTLGEYAFPRLCDAFRAPPTSGDHNQQHHDGRIPVHCVSDESAPLPMGRVVLIPDTEVRRRAAQGKDPFPPACLVVVPGTVEGLARARMTLDALVRLGVSPARTEVLYLEDGGAGAVAVAVAQTELGCALIPFPFDRALAARAEETGRLIQVLRPRSAMARALWQLAERLNAPAASSGQEPLSATDVERAVAERLWEEFRNTGSGGGQVEAFRRGVDARIREVFSRTGGDVPSPKVMGEIRQSLYDAVLGLGPVEALLRDPDVTEIMVNGAGGVWVERRGALERSSANFKDDTQLRTVIDRMVGPTGRRVDAASPLCDVRLSDGSRVNVVLPPVSLHGPVVTIRRFSSALLAAEDLIRRGSLDGRCAGVLREAVRARRNILVAGNSGAGKTTLLNILSGWIEAGERVITVEDTAELKLQQPHVVRLEARPANAEGEGEITIRDLVVHALRMRPDRLVVGECRGAEAIPMLQAMNTGHDGSMTTLHANSAADALRRLEAMVLLGAPQWPIGVVRQQIASAVDVVVFLHRCRGVRKVVGAAELREAGGEIILEDL